MINLLQYLLEVNVYLALAYGGYWLLLRRQTFYSANRVYLLASALLCFAIPLVQISFATPEALPVTQVLVQEVLVQDAPSTTPTPQPQAVFEPFKAITALYITGATLGFVLLCAKLYRLLKLIFTSHNEKRDGYTLVLVPETSSPFSFMGYLFVADEQQLQPVILKHELVHITQKHSYDVLFTELLKIVCWFNPAGYLLQNSLKTIHEFEADRLTAEKTEQDGYVDFLIAQACHNSGLSFANHFSEKQLLKSRIMKLYQKRSGSLARLNYLMALPLCAGMLAASSLAFSKDYGLKLELGKTPKKNLIPESITNYASENKTQSPETIFPAPTVRSDDGKVSSNATVNFESVIAPEKVKSSKKVKDSTAQQKAQASLSHVQKYVGTLLLKLPDTIAKTALKDLKMHLARTMRYPEEARKTNTSGSVLASMQVDENKKLSNISIKESKDAALNAEVVKKLSAFSGTVDVKPGTYTMRVTFKLEGFTAENSGKKDNTHELSSFGEVVVVGYSTPPPPPAAPRDPGKIKRPALPPPPPPVEKPDTSTAVKKGIKVGSLNMMKHIIGTVIMGTEDKPGDFATSFKKDMYVRPQLVYIQVDEIIPRNIKKYEPVKHGDHSWYLINGKLYDAQALEKSSAAISTKEKLATLLHAKGTIYHKPDDAKTIKRFGESIGKNGVTEFVDVIWSKI